MDHSSIHVESNHCIQLIKHVYLLTSIDLELLLHVLFLVYLKRYMYFIVQMMFSFHYQCAFFSVDGIYICMHIVPFRM